MELDKTREKNPNRPYITTRNDSFMNASPTFNLSTIQIDVKLGMTLHSLVKLLLIVIIIINSNN